MNQYRELAFDRLDTFVPEHDRESIRNYIDHRVPMGAFLTAVVENNLSRAIACADDTNLKHLYSIVRWFYQCAPSLCWGSQRRHEAWLAKQETA